MTPLHLENPDELRELHARANALGLTLTEEPHRFDGSSLLILRAPGSFVIGRSRNVRHIATLLTATENTLRFFSKARFEATGGAA